MTDNLPSCAHTPCVISETRWGQLLVRLECGWRWLFGLASSDFAHECATKIFERVEKADPKVPTEKGCFTRWSNGFAKFEARNWLRSRRARTDDTGGVERVADRHLGPDEEAIAKEELEVIHRIVLGLSERDQQVVKDICDRRRAEEIAAREGITAKAVHVRIHRVRSKIRHLLREYDAIQQIREPVFRNLLLQTRIDGLQLEESIARSRPDLIGDEVAMSGCREVMKIALKRLGEELESADR